VVLAIGISLFMVIGEFWSSFGVAMLCYYVGGILILGNTPGVCLFAPRPRGVEHSDNRTVAVPAAVPPSPPAAEPSSQSPSTVYPFATARRRARMN